MWTWMTAAPAAWHSLAVVTSSSRVTGSAGTADFSDSAPVGATVISVPPRAGAAGRLAEVWFVMTRRMPPSGTGRPEGPEPPIRTGASPARGRAHVHAGLGGAASSTPPLARARPSLARVGPALARVDPPLARAGPPVARVLPSP